MILTPDTFNFLKLFVYEKTGIALGEDKKYLVENRISPIIKKYNLLDFADIVVAVKQGNVEITEDVINSMTTNETYFMRDIKPFETFQKEILPQIIKNVPFGSKIRILSAACSAGQEAYSIAMIFEENIAKIKDKNLTYEIIGIDIDSKIVVKAENAIYSQFEVQRGLPITHLIKYFDKVSETAWKVKDKLKVGTHFYKKSLLEPLRDLGSFDCIFCRNVLIYFNEDTKVKVLKNLSNQCRSGSFLVTGASETQNLVPDIFKQSLEHRSVFERV